MQLYHHLIINLDDYVKAQKFRVEAECTAHTEIPGD